MSTNESALPVNHGRTNPQVTGWAFLIIAAWAATHVVAYFRIMAFRPEVFLDPSMREQQELALLYFEGCLYGLASGGVWLFGGIETKRWRWPVQLLVVATVVGLLACVGSSRPLAYAASVGGMVVSQLVLFHLFAIPTWRWRRVDSSANNVETVPPRRQFSIADVAGLTFLFAGLFTIVQRTPVPIDGMDFWPILAACWVIEPIVAALLFSAATQSGAIYHQVLKAAVAFGLTIALVGILGYAEVVVMLPTLKSLQVPPSHFFATMAQYYGILLAGFFVMVALFAATGWLSTRLSSVRADDADSAQAQSV